MQNLMWSVLRTKGRGKDEEIVRLGEKIFVEFSEALRDIDNVLSLEVLAIDLEENKSPVIVENGHVGIKLWGVPLMFHHAYSQLMCGGPAEVEDLTRCVLLCCPDFTTAWNRRKAAFVKKSDTKAFNIELSLTKLVLLQHPKSSETFAHRRWVVLKITENLIQGLTKSRKHLDNCPPDHRTSNPQNKTSSTETTSFNNEVGQAQNSQKTRYDPNEKKSLDRDKPKLQTEASSDKMESLCAGPLDQRVTNSNQCTNPRNNPSPQNFEKCNGGANSTKAESGNVRNGSAQKLTVPHTRGPSQEGLRLGENVTPGTEFPQIQRILYIVREEFSVCKLAGEKQKSNYNAWAHKSWVIDNVVLKLCKRLVSMSKNPPVGIFKIFQTLVEFLRQDLHEMSLFAGKNISDISVLNCLLHEQVRWSELCELQSLFRENDKIFDVWVGSLHHNSNMLDIYDAHEALWCHRRNLVLAFHKTSFSCKSSAGIGKVFSVESEAEFCRKFLAPSCGQKEQEHAARHLTFLNKFLK